MTEYWQIAALGLYSCLVGVVILRHLKLRKYLENATSLAPNSPQVKIEAAPRVSILVPAKDEEHTIATCLETLGNLNYPNYEVLIVDDRSEDRTADIVREYAEIDERIKLIQVEMLPEGWTGKTHALQYAQRFATGEWLWFVDADTHHHPDTLSVSLKHAIDNQLDLLSALPRLECRSFWERVIQPYASMCLVILYPLNRANDHSQLEAAWANGQFILMSRTAYDGMGQHASVRDKFVEDIALAKCARRNGYRTKMVGASDLFSVRMYSDLGQIVRGWSRIFYSAVDFKPRRLVKLLIFLVLFALSPYIVTAGSALALASNPASVFVQVLFAMAVVHAGLQLSLYARIYSKTRSPRYYAAYQLLSAVAMAFIILKTIRMCYTHQVNWRGTEYNASLQTSDGLGSVYLETEAENKAA